MKKLFFFLLFSFLQILIFAQDVSLETLRKEYHKVNSDSASCAKLFEIISQTKNTDNIIIAYKGAITVAMANHIKNKLEKINLFISGKKLIEQAITTDSSDIELRFLRFSIQTNCPKGLGYYKQITADKNFIIKNFPSVKNNDVKNEISSFVLQSNYFNESEKQKIKAYRK